MDQINWKKLRLTFNTLASMHLKYYDQSCILNCDVGEGGIYLTVIPQSTTDIANLVTWYLSLFIYIVFAVLYDCFARPFKHLFSGRNKETAHLHIPENSLEEMLSDEIHPSLAIRMQSSILAQLTLYQSR